MAKVAEEKTSKVQITISPRDGDNTVTSRAGSARAPNVNVKTPIVVKRTEPGKPPTLSSLSTKTPQHQVWLSFLCMTGIQTTIWFSSGFHLTIQNAALHNIAFHLTDVFDLTICDFMCPVSGTWLALLNSFRN